MAITVYVEVSTSGYSDADFSPLTDYTETAPFQYDHSPVTPGQLYIYRARRLNTDTGLYSAWAYAFARAPYPIRTPHPMLDTQEVYTSGDERFFVAIEPFNGVPTKAQYRAELVSGSPSNELQRRYSRQKRAAKTNRRTGVKGTINYTLPGYTFEIRAEGATIAFLSAAMKYDGTTDLSSPTRYRHRFSNKKGLKTLTVIHQIGTIYKVYVGVKVGTLSISPDWNGTDVLNMSLDSVAAGYFEFDSRITATAETTLGISTATADISTPYAPDEGTVYLNGIAGAGAQDMSVTLTNNFIPYKERDGTRSPKGFVEEKTETSANVTTYFNRETTALYYKHLGYTSDPTAAYGPQCGTLQTVPLSMVFNPCVSAGAVQPIFGVYMPQVDPQIQTATQDAGEVQYTIDVAPIDAVGESSNTDMYIEVTNSVSGTSIVAPGTPIAPTDVPSGTADVYYTYGAAQASSTTTSIIGGTNPNLSSVDDTYNGRRLRFITGTLAGQERVISDYTGSTKTFTVAAFGGAPSTGDAFVVI